MITFDKKKKMITFDKKKMITFDKKKKKSISLLQKDFS